MEFTAGLMPLETALSQMLSRITPLTAVETLPLIDRNCHFGIFAVFGCNSAFAPNYNCFRTPDN